MKTIDQYGTSVSHEKAWLPSFRSFDINDRNRSKTVREPILVMKSSLMMIALRGENKKYDCDYLPSSIDDCGLYVLRPVLKHQYNSAGGKVPTFFRCEVYAYEPNPETRSNHICDIDVSRRDYRTYQTESDYLACAFDKEIAAEQAKEIH